MEERISYIFIYYRGHLYKGVAIFDAIETNLQQKKFAFMNKNVYYEHWYKD
jgi:hypothetical protein